METKILIKGSLKRFIKYGIIGGIGTSLNLGVFYLLTRLGLYYLIASVIATEIAIVSNFLGNTYFTFSDKPRAGLGRKFLSFQAISLVTLVGTVGILWLLTSLFGQKFLLLWNLFSILSMFVVNYILNSMYTWKESPFANGMFKRLRTFFIVAIIFLAVLSIIFLESKIVKATVLNDTTNVSINITSNITNNITDNISSNITNNITNNISSNITNNISTNITENITSNITANITANITSNITENISSNITTNISNNITNNISSNITGNITGNSTSNPPYIGIISASTDLKHYSNNSYYMYDVDNATFAATLNSSSSMDWYIDGVLTKSAVGNNDTFTFVPGIYYVPAPPDYSNVKAINITLMTSNSSIIWLVDVIDAINPYFTSLNDGPDNIGDPDTKIHVLTNNNILNFSSVIITLTNSLTTKTLSLNPVASGNQTDWSAQILNISYGNNYLTKIIGIGNSANSTYTLDNSRAHYRIPPAPVHTSSGGGGGGGYSSDYPDNASVVYALFGKDVIGTNQTQNLTLDAKDLGATIDWIKASILTPQGNQIIDLKLIKGDNYYGTWFGMIDGNIPGQYNLTDIMLGKNNTKNYTQFFMHDRSFYVSGTGTGSLGSLRLINYMLSEAIVNVNDSIMLTADASDAIGINSIYADINYTNHTFVRLTLTRINGNEYYGTWQGSFKADKPDTTYNIDNIVLKNKNQTSIYNITDRSVYVNSIPYKPPNIVQVTGLAAFSVENFLKQPMTPSIIAFTMLLLIMLLGIFFNRTNIGNKIK